MLVIVLITTLRCVALYIASSGLELYGYIGGKIIVRFEQMEWHHDEKELEGYKN